MSSRGRTRIRAIEPPSLWQTNGGRRMPTRFGGRHSSVSGLAVLWRASAADTRRFKATPDGSALVARIGRRFLRRWHAFGSRICGTVLGRQERGLQAAETPARTGRIQEIQRPACATYW